MVLLGQCKKQDPKYKAIAVETTGNVVEALHVDVFSDLQEVLIPVLLPVSFIYENVLAFSSMTFCFYTYPEDARPRYVLNGVGIT